jgi:hypothetical protein
MMTSNHRVVVWLLSLVAAAVVGFGPAIGKAGTFYSGPGIINLFEDSDFEKVFNRVGPAGTVDVGDWFFGVFSVSTVRKLDEASGLQLDSENDDQFEAVFAFEVESIVPGGGDPPETPFLVTFKPIPFVDGADADTFDDNWQSLGLIREAVGTMFRFYDDTAPTTPVNGSAGSVAAAQDGVFWWEVGFTGPGGTSTGATSEFFLVESSTLSTTPTPSAVIDFASSTNITLQGAGPRLQDHSFLSDTDANTFWNDVVEFPGSVSSQFQLGGHKFGTGTTFFPISTNTDIYVKAIPLPPALALCLTTLPGFGGLMMFWRRRK